MSETLPLLKGTLELLIMKALSAAPMHGYGLSIWMERGSSGAIVVEDSAIYQALRRLEGKRLVEAEWGLTENNRRARFYRLTSLGEASARVRGPDLGSLRRLRGHAHGPRWDPSSVSRYRRWLRLGGRTRQDRLREVDDELEAHVRLHMDDLVAHGVPADEAERRARERLGDRESARRSIGRAARERDRRLEGYERLDGVRRDIVIALRRMYRRPGQAALSILIFAFGVSLTTTMFTVVDNVLLRPLPFPEPDELVALYSVPEEGAPFPWVSMGNWYDWDRENRTLRSTTIHSQAPMDITVSGLGQAFVAPGVRVYGRFFETLGVPLALGRTPSQQEVTAGAQTVVVSDDFWRRELGARPIEGLSLNLDGLPHDVVGVVAAGYEHPEGTELWQPLPERPQGGMARNNINFRAIGRLAPTSTVDAARSDLSAIADGIRTSDPEGIYSWGVDVRPLADVLVSDARRYLLLLMGAVVVVLLIGCANLAALGFARGAERADEVALRMSLGAKRGRLVRQLVSEELLLAAIGGALGMALAWVSTSVLLGSIGEIVPRFREVSFDLRIAAFGVAISLLAGMLSGLPPALRASREAVGRSLVGARTVRGRGGLPGAALVAGEVALTVLLVTGGSLLFFSLQALGSRDLGFDPERVGALKVALVSDEYRRDDQRVLTYWRQVHETLGADPRVASVGLGVWIPTDGGGAGFIDLRGDDAPEGGAAYRIVGGDYFGSLRIPLVRGRLFDERDDESAELVTVVSEAMAREAWPDQDPIGQRVRASSMESFHFGGEAPWRTVVGVVGDVRQYGFDDEPRGTMYVPHMQILGMARAMSATIRFDDAADLAALPELQRAIQALDPSLAVQRSEMGERLRRRLGERRMIFALLSGFALAGLLLAALGVYGVISFAVAGRTREMAVRFALGADRRNVIGLVVGGAMGWVAVGGVVGGLMAFLGRGIIDSLLVDVSSGDARAYIVTVLLLAAVTACSALLPALRASRLSPQTALRDS